MRRKKTMVAAVLGIVLLGTAHAAYGYWTDQIQVREEVALVWPVEVEIEEESAEAGSEESESTEAERMETKEAEAECDGIGNVKTENPEYSGEHLQQEPEA